MADVRMRPLSPLQVTEDQASGHRPLRCHLAIRVHLGAEFRDSFIDHGIDLKAGLARRKARQGAHRGDLDAGD